MKKTRPRKIPLVWIIIIAPVGAALFLGLLLRFDAEQYVMQLFRWLNQIGLWAPVLFIIIQVLVMLLLIPNILLTLGAGFLFGAVLGTIYVVIGTTIGASISFLLARYLLGERADAFIQKREQFRVLDEKLVHKGWRVILLTRLIPFFPFKLSNYIFGLTHFTFRDFVIGTLFGIIPLTATNVYAGSLAADLATLQSRAQKTPLQWTLYGLGLLVLAALVYFLTRMARKKLDKYSGNDQKLSDLH